ncbi:hypothetical protein FDECE_15813 [Fusarium decemcellulare]|nr:hypothetical protein FDECE_15813 [Fusarium decemcellulare]
MSLSRRTCKSFETKGKSGRDGATTPYPNVLRTSAGVNCTAQLARSDGGNRTLCDYKRYSMGITLNSTINVSISDTQTVLNAVRDAASPKTAAYVNLNETVLLPYNNTEPGVLVGDVGYWTFTPYLRCWEGLLKSCDGDDIDQDGTAVEVCGYQLNSWKEDGSTTADGETTFLTTDEKTARDAKGIPYPTWEEAVKKQNEAKEKDDKSAGTGARCLLEFASTHAIWAGLGTCWLLA